MFNHTSVAFSQQEAFTAALDFMKKTNNSLWEIGQANGGFMIAGSSSFTLDELKKYFGEEEKPMATVSMVLANDPENERKNRLISEIIEYKNRDLLEANKKYLTEWDILYIEDKLK